MKRFLAVFLAAVLLMGLCGCDQAEPEQAYLDTVVGNATEKPSSVAKEEPEQKAEPEQSIEAPEEPNEKEDLGCYSTITNDGLEDDASAEPYLTEEGVVIPIPQMFLGPPRGNVDYASYFIYKGRVYRASRGNIPTDLRGEKVADLKGWLHDWNAEDGQVELAGSIDGPVYAVRGIDPSLMLCQTDPDGEKTWLYLCDNGMTLKTGADLLDRLALSSNYEELRFAPYAQWAEGEDAYFTIKPEFFGEVDAFLEALSAAPAELDPTKGKNEKILYRMLFLTKEGVPLDFYLYQNGTVVLSHRLGFVPFRLSGEAFQQAQALFGVEEKAEKMQWVEVDPTDAECRKVEELGAYVPTAPPDGYRLERAERYFDNDSDGFKTEVKELRLYYTGAGSYTVRIFQGRTEEYPEVDLLTPEGIADCWQKGIEAGVCSETTVCMRYTTSLHFNVTIEGSGLTAEEVYEVLYSSVWW